MGFIELSAAELLPGGSCAASSVMEKMFGGFLVLLPLSKESKAKQPEESKHEEASGGGMCPPF